MKTSLTFKMAALALATTTLAFATPAAAQYSGYTHSQQNSSGDQLLGAGIGAIAGGVLGSQLAGNGARTEGSVLGAVIGGVAGAAIVGDGNSGRRVYNQGYYNPQTGYYNGGYTQGGYYQQRPVYTYQNQGYTTYRHHPQPYYSPAYPQRTFVTTTYQNVAPVYGRPAFHPYYRAPRTGISINIGNGGYYQRGRHFNNRGHHHRRKHPRRRHHAYYGH